mmetsp:Transcript_15048/g.32254  ORF Transcript_15048/g.32254 Transcript_15048/m.32254 type:complete len:269 (+) Transcript_15048:174-980(+)
MYRGWNDQVQKGSRDTSIVVVVVVAAVVGREQVDSTGLEFFHDFFPGRIGRLGACLVEFGHPANTRSQQFVQVVRLAFSGLGAVRGLLFRIDRCRCRCLRKVHNGGAFFQERDNFFEFRLSRKTFFVAVVVVVATRDRHCRIYLPCRSRRFERRAHFDNNVVGNPSFSRSIAVPFEADLQRCIEAEYCEPNRFVSKKQAMDLFSHSTKMEIVVHEDYHGALAAVVVFDVVVVASSTRISRVRVRVRVRLVRCFLRVRLVRCFLRVRSA